MPIYQVGDAIYDIPQEKASGFEAAYPNATIRYATDDGSLYDIPVNKRDGFIKAFPSAKPWAAAPEEEPDNLNFDDEPNPGKKETGVRARQSISAPSMPQRDVDPAMAAIQPDNFVRGMKDRMAAALNEGEAYKRLGEKDVMTAMVLRDEIASREAKENKSEKEQEEIDRLQSALNDIGSPAMIDRKLGEIVKDKDNLIGPRTEDDQRLLDLQHELYDQTPEGMDKRHKALIQEYERKMKENGKHVYNIADDVDDFNVEANLAAIRSEEHQDSPRYDAANWYLERAQTILEAGQQKDDMWASLWTGVKEGLSTENLFSSIRSSFAGQKIAQLAEPVNKILEKVDDNASERDIENALKKGLTPGQYALIDAYRQYVRANAEVDPGFWYKAGNTTGGSVAIMGEFLLAGGLTSGIKKGIEKGTSKLLTYFGTKEMPKLAERALKSGVNYFGANLSALARSAVQTALSPRTAAHIQQNSIGLDKEGRIQAGKGNAADDFLNEWIENATEYGYGIANKVLGKGAGLLSKGKFGILTPEVKSFLEKAGVHSFTEEWGEELNGAIYRSILKDVGVLRNDGTNELKDFFNIDNQLLLLASFAPTIGGGAVISAAQRRVFEKKEKTSFERLKESLGTEDTSILDGIEGETPEELAINTRKALSKLYNDGELTDDVLKAAIDYVQAKAYSKSAAQQSADEDAQVRSGLRAQIESELGTDKWVQSGVDAGTNTPVESVETVTYEDGTEYFVVAHGEDGSVALTSRDGQRKLIQGTNLSNGVDDEGNKVTYSYYHLDDYLSGRMDAEKEVAEQERMTAEMQQANEQLLQQAQPGVQINLGSVESPEMATILGSDSGNYIVQKADGTTVPFTPQEMADKLGIETVPKTDEQIVEEQAQRIEQSENKRKAANDGHVGQALTFDGQSYTFVGVSGTEESPFNVRVIDAEGNELTIPMTEQQFDDVLDAWSAAPVQEEAPAEPVDDGIPRDFRGNPLPMRTNKRTGQQVVAENDLWNNDPEAWAVWNDTNPHQKVSSKERLEFTIKELDKDIDKDTKAVQKAALQGIDEDKMDDMEDALGKKIERRELLSSILDKYNMPAAAGSTIASEQRKAAAEQTIAEQQAGFPGIQQKWNGTPNVTGASDEIRLANGETISGHYVLTDATAPTASHNPSNGFAMTEGFPVDENGKTVNDRDYEHDQAAQASVFDKAANYDQRALQTPVIVSNDGVVLSGNDRTMASQIAAANNTDKAYTDYLAKYPQKYGFTAEQVGRFQHPRVVFVPDAAMPYNAATFAKFNAEDKKSQSKTEKAVKAGKTLSPEALGSLASLVDRFDDINALYNDAEGVDELLNILLAAEVITQEQVAALKDGDKLSGTGMDLLESTLIGAALDEEAVRIAMADASIRKSVVSAISQILVGNTLAEYNLRAELTDAIQLVAAGKAAKEIKFGESVQSYVRQQHLFQDDVVAEATVQMIADAINDRKTSFLKKVLSLYNRDAVDSANGQMNLLTGDVLTREAILRNILEYLGYDTNILYDTSEREAEQRAAAEPAAAADQAAAPEQNAPSVQSDEGSAVTQFNREEVAAILEQGNVGETGLAEYMTDEEVAEFMRLWDAFLPYNDALGEAYNRLGNDLRATAPKKTREAAQAEIDRLEIAQEEAFAPIQSYVDTLLEKYGLSTEEVSPVEENALPEDVEEEPEGEFEDEGIEDETDTEDEEPEPDGPKPTKGKKGSKKSSKKAEAQPYVVKGGASEETIAKQTYTQEEYEEFIYGYSTFTVFESKKTGEQVQIYLVDDTHPIYHDHRCIVSRRLPGPNGKMSENGIYTGQHTETHTTTDYLIKYLKANKFKPVLDEKRHKKPYKNKYGYWVNQHGVVMNPIRIELPSVKKGWVSFSETHYYQDDSGKWFAGGSASHGNGGGTLGVKKGPYDTKSAAIRATIDALQSFRRAFPGNNTNLRDVDNLIRNLKSKTLPQAMLEEGVLDNVSRVEITASELDNGVQGVLFGDEGETLAPAAKEKPKRKRTGKKNVEKPAASAENKPVEDSDEEAEPQFVLEDEEGTPGNFHWIDERTCTNPIIITMPGGDRLGRNSKIALAEKDGEWYVAGYVVADGGKGSSWGSVIPTFVSSYIPYGSKFAAVKAGIDGLRFILDNPARKQQNVLGETYNETKDLIDYLVKVELPNAKEKDSRVDDIIERLKAFDNANGIAKTRAFTRLMKYVGESLDYENDDLNNSLKGATSRFRSEQLDMGEERAKAQYVRRVRQAIKDATGNTSMTGYSEVRTKPKKDFVDEHIIVAGVPTPKKAGKKAEEPAYGSQNKMVTTDQYEELKRRMKEKLGQLNAGFDPETFFIGAQMAVYHVEAGARKFVDFSKRMIGDLGDAIRPYLKAIYNGARDLPGMEELKKNMNTAAEVDAINPDSIGLDYEDWKSRVKEGDIYGNERVVSVDRDSAGGAGMITTEYLDSEGRATTSMPNFYKQVFGEDVNAQDEETPVPDESTKLPDVEQPKWMSREPSEIQGLESLSTLDVYALIEDHIDKVMGGAITQGFNGFSLVDMIPIGSRAFGTAREDSDLDILVEYEGDAKEDAVFNVLNGEPLEILGIKVDFFPIRAQESGTMTEWLKSHDNGRPVEKEQPKEQVRDEDKNFPTLDSWVEDAKENFPAVMSAENVAGLVKLINEVNGYDENTTEQGNRIMTFGRMRARFPRHKYAFWKYFNLLEEEKQTSKSEGNNENVSDLHYFDAETNTLYGLQLVKNNHSGDTVLRSYVERYNEPASEVTQEERLNEGDLVVMKDKNRFGGVLKVVAVHPSGSYDLEYNPTGVLPTTMVNVGADEIVPMVRNHREDISSESELPVQEEAPVETSQPSENGGKLTVGELGKYTHTKTGQEMTIVRLTGDRLSSDEFKRLKARAKAFGGYYSSYGNAKGFLFENEEDAINFNTINETNNAEEITNEQTAADTAVIVSEAASVASEAETLAEAEDASEPESAEIIDSIDETLDAIDEQLALLGYYEADKTGPFNESYGYMKSAEKKAVKDADRLAKKLAADLGIDVGRKTLAKANIAPAGGEVSFRLPLNDGHELYMCINLVPSGYQTGYGYEDDLVVRGALGGGSLAIYFRVENPNASGQARYVTPNNNQPYNVSYADLLNAVRRDARDFLPEAPAETTTANGPVDILQVAKEQAEKNRKSKKKSVSSQEDGDAMLGGLFDTLYEAEDTAPNVDETPAPAQRVKPTEVNGFTKGEKVLYTPNQGKRQQQEATIYDFEYDGRPVLDTGLAPILYEVVDWSQISKIENEPINTSDNGLQGNDELRPEGLSADGDRQSQGVQRGTGEEGEVSGQESGRADRGGEGRREGDVHGRSRTLRPRFDDSVKRNTHNNRISKGEVVYPKTPAARYKANIAAIRLLKELQDSGKQATKEQMSVLRQYTGWGGLGGYFNNEYSAEYRELRSLLTDEEMQAAALSINTAYYTPVDVIDAMWDIAKRLGFEGGNVLEGSAGIGNILASMPKSMSEHSAITAVELDDITGGILRLLYPDADVQIKGFQDADIPNGSVDLAITNVPFGDINVYDAKEKDITRKFGGKIHDFCIAKNVRKLAEGGIGIFISTRGTLDNSSKALRQWIVNEGGADVIGAFRLNNATFEGTGATSDIIVVRKRVNGHISPNAINVTDTQITRREEIDTGDRDWNPKTRMYEDRKVKAAMEVNTYFVEHPENMGGEMGFGYEHNDSYRPASSSLWPTDKIDQNKRLAKWAKQFSDMQEEVAPTETAAEKEEESTATKEGQLVLNTKGDICISRSGKAVPLGVNPQKVKGYTKAQVLADYDALKIAINDALDYQLKNESDEGLKPLLEKLNKAYDRFAKRYERLNRNTAISFLRNDVDFPSIAAVEDYKEKKDMSGKVKIEVKKTNIFSGRVLGAKRVPTPSNAKDGVIISINQFGRIDLPFIANALNKSEDDVRAEILSSGLGFENPMTGEMEVEYEYLSGNVREKLEYARAHNVDGRYDKNIEALEKVIPADIPAHLIEFSLGSDWMPTELYTEYAKDKFGVNDNFVPSMVGGSWIIPENEWEMNLNTEKNRAAGVHSESLRMDKRGHELMIAAMNNASVVFSRTYRDSVTGESVTETDKAATQAATAKMSEMRDDFKEWCRAKMLDTPELAERIAKIYNDTFNALVPKEIRDTFIPEHFEGQVLTMGKAGKPFHMYPHQAKAVIRATTEPLMMAHEVGAGKTFTLIASAMEMRRLGTAKKPMIVVQNATLGQFVSSAKELYPNAKVLTISESDRTVEGRGAFYAKIKYNDWDMIIVPQSVFEMIPDSEERQRAFIQEKIDEKKFILEQAKAANNSAAERQLKKELEDLEYEYQYGEKPPKKGKGGKKDAKKEAEAVENAVAKAKKQLDRRTDDVSDFDDMGIDALLVDEAHSYKHLGFSTAMQRGVKGVDATGSKKSAGVYLKTRAVFDKVGWKNVVFATGTPISNTAAEIWTFMKYLMPADVMRQNHIYYFDDFVRNFGNISQSLEFTTSGKFKENTRFAAYTNLPELVRIWASVSDTVLAKDALAAGGEKLEDKQPKMEGGKARDIYLPQSPSLVDIMNAVRAKLEWYENLSGKEKKENSHIPLVMFGIAKMAAIDPRLVDKNAVDEPSSKTNKAVEETIKALKDSERYKGTCALFCDNYRRWDTDAAGKRYEGFNIFEEIKRKLVEAGVPEDQIVIMKSGMTTAAKEKIFARVNSGEVRVIMGTTATLGTGVNIQERLFFEAHLDAPNRPMDYTQRNGRILRQGNLHKEWDIPVRVVRFGVEDSLDVTAYQRLSTKSKFINSVMDGKPLLANNMDNRVLEEAEEGEFDNPVAVLSGSQYALLKSQAERELRKLRNKKEQHRQDQIYIERTLKDNKNRITYDEKLIDEAKSNLAKVKEAFPDGTVKEISIEGRKAKGNEQIAEAIKDKITAPLRSRLDSRRVERGFTNETLNYSMTFDGVPVNIKVDVERINEYDDKRHEYRPVMRTRVEYSVPRFGIEGRFVQGGYSSIKDIVPDFVGKIATGRYFDDAVNNLTNTVNRLNADNELMLQRRGKPFADEDKLAKQEEIVKDYTEKMKAELAEKEAKYAEMAKNAKTTFNLDNVDIDDDADGEEASAEYSDMDDNGFFSGIKDRQDDEDAFTFTTRVVSSVVEKYPFLKGKIVTMSAANLTPEKQNELENGRYSHKLKKIIIFAKDNRDSADGVERTIMHEAIHMLIDDFGWKKNGHFINLFNTALVASGYYSVDEYREIFADVKATYEEKGNRKYSDAEIREEMVTFELSQFMLSGLANEFIAGAKEFMPELGEQLEQIVNTLGYEPTKESESRMDADVLKEYREERIIAAQQRNAERRSVGNAGSGSVLRDGTVAGERGGEGDVQGTERKGSDLDEGGASLELVTDPETIQRLERGEKEHGYRTVVQNEDGSFGSPKASRLGKTGEKSRKTSAIFLEKWEKADENPDLATENGKINLVDSVGLVDYNPYIHIRPNAINKQFTAAWRSPKQVYIQTAYPKSELTSGYKAEKAKLSVGRHKWNNGDLILSRWDKPERIVPWEEIADQWEKEFKDTGVTFDIVNPGLLPVLASRGVEILPPKKAAGQIAMDAYNEWRSGVRNRPAYHGSGAVFTSLDSDMIGTGEGASAHGYGFYVAFNEDTAKGYANRIGNYDVREAGRVHWKVRELEDRLEYSNITEAEQEEIKQKLSVLYNLRSILESRFHPKNIDSNTELTLDESWVIRDAVASVSRWGDVARAIEESKAYLTPENKGTATYAMAEYLNSTKPEDWETNRNLYTLEVPEDDGFNYLDEQKELSKEQRRAIADALRALPDGVWKTTEDESDLFGDPTASKLANSLSKRLLNGYEMYAELVHGLGSKKAASEFLSNAGFVGIKYDGRQDGPCAVIFNADDIEIVNREMFREGSTGTPSPVSYSESMGARRLAVNETATKCGIEIEFRPSSQMQFNGKPLAGRWINGKMYICLEHCRDAADAVRTVLHEGVGHNGLRRLIGNENMSAFCLDVFNKLPDNARRDIADAAINKYGGDIAEATEEYLAESAEVMDFENADYERNFWDVVVDALRKVLAKIGINVPLSRRDVRWLMWQSYNANKQTDVLNEAKRQVVANRLGFTLRQQADKAEAVQKARNKIAEEDLAPAARIYNKDVVYWINRLHESWVDKDNAVGSLVTAIEKATGRKAAAFEDIRLALNQQSSKGLAAIEKWERENWVPMQEAIKALMKEKGCDLHAIERYVMIKHGLERNEVFAKRDAKAYYQDIRDGAVAVIDKALEDGKIDRDTRDALVDKEDAKLDKRVKAIEAGTDAKYKEFRKQDYGGLTAMYSEWDAIEPFMEGVESEEEYKARVLQARHPKYTVVDEAGREEVDMAATEEAAVKEVAEFENGSEKAVEELWKRINNATKATLKHQYNANMIGRQQYLQVKDMFNYYVPLRGFADNTAEDMYDYYQSDQRNVFTPPLLKAKGRKTEAESPFGYIGSMASSGIAADMKNETKLALYYFVSNRAANDLVNISEVWYKNTGVDELGRRIFTPVYPPLKEDLSGEDAKKAYEDWEDMMKEEAKAGFAFKGSRKLNLHNSVIHIDKKQKDSHVIKFKVGGRDMMMYINGNPRAAQAINNELNVEMSSDYQRVFGKILRWFSGINTSYNPEFWLSNAQRDAFFALMSVNVKEDGEYNREFRKNFRSLILRTLTPGAKGGAYSLKHKLDTGKLGDERLDNYYKEFVENGGVTGYTTLKNNEEWELELRKYTGQEKQVLKAIKTAFEKVQHFGEAIEQMTRFAAYITAREQGKEIKDAVNDAKELTVNFNRKGSGKAITFEEAARLRTKNGKKLPLALKAVAVGASWLPVYGRRFIMFFNASVQGLNAMYKLYKKKPWKAGVWAAGYLALGVVQALLHAMLDDDDDYLDIPDYERRNNLLIGGNGVYFKWALPQECRVFYGIGDMVVNHLMGRTPHKSILSEILASASDIAPLNAAGGLAAISPSALTPIVEVALNRDYKGSKIYNDMRYLSDEERARTPKYTMAYQGTGKVYVMLSQFANWISGGDYADAGWLNINPAIVEHLVKGATGGAGTTLGKLYRGTVGQVLGEDFSVRNTPFLSRILTVNDDRYRNVHTTELYEYYKAEAEHTKKLMNTYRKNGDFDKLDELLDSEDYEIMMIYESYQGLLKYYTDELKETTDKDERKALMREQDALRKEMIKEISNIGTE